MNCPICNVELQLAERQRVEVHVCPTCRGVWLDRGELYKIVEGAVQDAAASSFDEDDYPPDEGDDERDRSLRRTEGRSRWVDLFEF